MLSIQEELNRIEKDVEESISKLFVDKPITKNTIAIVSEQIKRHISAQEIPARYEMSDFRINIKDGMLNAKVEFIDTWVQFDIEKQRSEANDWVRNFLAGKVGEIDECEETGGTSSDKAVFCSRAFLDDCCHVCYGDGRHCS